MKESVLSKKIRKAVNLDGRCRVVRCNTGLYRALHDETRVRCGLGNGTPDLPGMVIDPSSVAFGRVMCLEVKRPGKIPTERDPSTWTDTERDQVAWHRARRSGGGFCAFVDSVAAALSAVDRACAGSLE